MPLGGCKYVLPLSCFQLLQFSSAGWMFWLPSPGTTLKSWLKIGHSRIRCIEVKFYLTIWKTCGPNKSADTWLLWLVMLLSLIWALIFVGWNIAITGGWTTFLCVFVRCSRVSVRSMPRFRALKIRMLMGHLTTFIWEQHTVGEVA